MATPIPDGMYLAKLRWRLVGDPDEMISTIGLRNNEPGDRPFNDIAESVYEAWVHAFQPANLSNQWAFVGVDVVAGLAGDENGVGTWSAISTGEMTQDPLPQNSAMLLRKHTAQAGRRNSGRMYIPSGYMAEVDVSASGMHAAGSLTAYGNWATQFYDNLRDSTAGPGGIPTSYWPIIIHSEPVDSQGNVTGPAPGPTDITSFSIDPVIATQRQRLRR